MISYYTIGRCGEKKQNFAKISKNRHVEIYSFSEYAFCVVTDSA